MYCNYCGAELNENASFCPNCGEQFKLNLPVEVQAPATAAPAADEPSSTPILVLGIIAAAASDFGIPGIVLGAIGRKKAKAYLEKKGEIKGKALVGSILSKVGLILGIVMTVFWTMYITFIIAFVIAAINTHFWVGV